MKKTALSLAIGMGAGAFLYSYTKKHPIKTKQIEKNIKNMMKDFE